MRAFERLSGQDVSFLFFETLTTPMNVGGVAVFDGGTLVQADGGVDIERIKAYLVSRLHKVDRYRHRLAYIPLENQPVWVDDRDFDIDCHVHHAALPRPGSDAQLKRLAADILSRPLDRRRPLWESWIVEGLAERRFALVSKAHHCMVDGISGLDLNAVMMSAAPRSTFPPPRRWQPQRPPSGVEMLRDDVLARVRVPFTTPTQVPNREVRRSDIGQRLAAIWQTLQSGLRSAANTPLNRPLSPQRRFEGVQIDLERIKEVKNRFGGTVNDVVLATVAGALRRFLGRRKLALSDLDFRVAVPVNVRSSEDLHVTGNRTSVWLTSLPVGERDPRRRLARICAATANLKQGGGAAGAELLMRLADWTGPAGVALGVRLAERMSPYNLIVTNVPGPQFPLYLLDARLLQAYPLVPLFENQGLGIALFSYDGQLYWGLNADRDLVPDLATLAADIIESFAELHACASAARPRTGRRPAQPAVR